MERKIQYCCYS